MKKSDQRLIRFCARQKHKDLIELVRRSDQLLKEPLEGKEDEVAKAIARVNVRICTDFLQQ